MNSSQPFQVPVVQGLNAKADAVDAQISEGFQLIRVQTVGIGFYGNLRTGAKGKMLMNALQQFG